ncbi:hypothetical protein ACFPRL_01760 [Pseudoclavibacter helvolus]
MKTRSWRPSSPRSASRTTRTPSGCAMCAASTRRERRGGSCTRT